MVMSNIGEFIAWGVITALFIEKGYLPNEQLATIVSPMLTYLLPLLIGLLVVIMFTLSAEVLSEPLRVHQYQCLLER